MSADIFNLHHYRKLKEETRSSSVGTTIEEGKQKILALIDKNGFHFRKKLETTEEYIALIDYLKKCGVQDLRVYLSDKTQITGRREILDPSEAIGQYIFMFSDEASIFLYEVLGDLHKKSITPSGETVIMSKK